jgi:hypothetical protein
MFVPARNRDASDPREPFSRAEARAAGLTAEMLLSKRFHKIFWDAYVSSDVPITSLLRAKAVIRLVPTGSYISHSTAAELWGAGPPPDGATHITLPSACGRQVRQGVRSHYHSQPAQTTLRWNAERSGFAGPLSRSGGCTFQAASASRLEMSNVSGCGRGRHR